MGLVYLPTWKLLKKSTIHIGKYTSPMDPSWVLVSAIHKKNMNWRWGQVGFDLKQQAGTEVFFGIHVSNAKKTDCLGYIWDYANATHGYSIGIIRSPYKDPYWIRLFLATKCCMESDPQLSRAIAWNSFWMPWKNLRIFRSVSQWCFVVNHFSDEVIKAESMSRVVGRSPKYISSHRKNHFV